MRLLLIFSLLLSTAVAQAADKSHCRKIILNPDLESAALRNFNLASVQPAQIERLARAVFKVNTGTDHDYVVRVPTEDHDMTGELFAIEFINSIPGLRARRALTASLASSKRFLQKLKQANRQRLLALGGLLNDVNELSELGARVSVALYYEAELGSKVLQKFGLFHEVLSILDAASRGDISERNGLSVRQRLKAAWPAESQQRDLLVADLKPLLTDSHMISTDNFLAYLLSHLSALREQDIQNLILTQVQRSPPHILRQLAEYWVAYAILGIADFHKNNWLMNQDQIFAIDSANPPEMTNSADPLKLSNHMNPFGIERTSPELRQLLYQSMGAEFKNYLAALSKKDIVEIAERARVALLPNNMKLILRRIRMITELN